MNPEKAQPTEVVEEEVGTETPVAESDSAELDTFFEGFDSDDNDGEVEQHPADNLTDEELELAAKGEDDETPEQTPEGETPEAETPTAEGEVPAEPETEVPEEGESETPEPEKAEETPEPQPEEQPEAPAPEVDFADLRAKAMADLEAKYSISEEDANLLATEPEKVLPKLAAQVYMDAFDSVTQGVMSVIPQMIHRYTQSQSLAQQAEQEFYSAWQDKGLNPSDEKHKQTVLRVAEVYRRLNPAASKEQFIAEVGAQSLYALGVPFAEIVDTPQETPPPAHVPATPRAAAPARQAPSNPWEEIAEEFLSDET